jgi:hypothetical protein
MAEAAKPEAAPAAKQVASALASAGRRSRRTSVKPAEANGAKGQTPFPSGVRLAVIP